VALLLAKGALAAVVSWALAYYVFTSPQPTYAPLVALMVVQSNVYRSVLHAVQYVGAVLVGILAAGAVNPLLGDNVAAFAIVLVTGLLVGRWKRLGTMGIEVPVLSIFAYDVLLGPTRVPMLGAIVSMVLLGAAVGLATNFLLLPPMRYASANEAVQELSTAVAVLLRDMAPVLREGTPGARTAEDWQRRARQLDITVSKARDAVKEGSESISYNPRRIFRKHRSAGFSGYRTMVQALARASEQTRSIATGIRNLLEDESGHTTDEMFFRPYAEILALVAEGIDCLGSAAGKEERGLRQIADACYARCEDLQAEAKEADAWPALGALLTDAVRLVEELANAHARGALRAD